MKPLTETHDARKFPVMSAKAAMTPLQVFLDKGDRRRLEDWSRRRGWTKSDAVRAAIRALVSAGEPPEQDSLLAGSGMIRGLPADMSASFDRYLAATFIAQKPTARRPAAQPEARHSRKPRLRR